MKTKMVKEEGRAEKSSKDRKTWVLSVRLSLSEREQLQARADAQEMSLSEFAREVLTNESDELKQRIPFKTDEDIDDDDGQGAKEEMEEFLQAVAQSARGLAAGWVRCKMLPRLESKRAKLTNRDTCELCQGEYTRGPGHQDKGLCGPCKSGIDTQDI